MLKYLTHKLRNHSLNEENVEEKVDGHDSGTESDDEIDRPEMLVIDPVCPVDAALREQQYDHHSSEEELEVINSTPKQDKFLRPYPSSAPCATEASCFSAPVTETHELDQEQETAAAASTLSASASTPELLLHTAAKAAESGITQPLTTAKISNTFVTSRNVSTSKQNERYPVNRLRCASAAAALPLPEKRKWSRVGPAHCHARKSDSSHRPDSQSVSRGPSSDPVSSDDYDDDLDFEDLLLLSPPPHGNFQYFTDDSGTPCNEFRGYSAPVRFRSSPPLEALKPGAAGQCTVVAAPVPVMVVSAKVCQGSNDVNAIARRESPVVIVRRDSDEAGDWSIDAPMEVRSLSPPTKVFHCSVSPKRRSARPSSSHQTRGHRHTHRPCLDFDKMQQLKARSVPAWRHSSERGGDLSVFCW